MAIELGARVQDRMTGAVGIVIGVTDWLYGCRRLVLQPVDPKDGRPAETFSIDEPQAIEVDGPDFKAAAAPAASKHGPREDATRKADPTR